MTFAKIEHALAAIARGELVVVVDDESRENEGDLVLAADCATPEKVAFMVRHTSGLLCVALPESRLNELQLPLMVAENKESFATAFTVSVDLRDGISTGISAADRSATLRALADPEVGAPQFVRPGHVFPLRARAAGVLERTGHTEAAVDLARLAGRRPAGVLAEVVNEDGSMARRAELAAFADRHGLLIITIADLVAYRTSTLAVAEHADGPRAERLIDHVAEARIPTQHGTFTAHVYRSRKDHIEHVALVYGNVRDEPDVLVRVHSECLTGDIFGSTRCDCGEQLDLALARVAAAGHGVVVYLRGHEGRGIGLVSKLHAYQLQDQGRDTVEANLDLGLPVDSRKYDVGAQILTDLGLSTIRLMSNNPAKFTELAGYRLKIVERVPLIAPPRADNIEYLRTKQQKMGHELQLVLHGALALAADGRCGLREAGLPDERCRVLS